MDARKPAVSLIVAVILVVAGALAYLSQRPTVLSGSANISSSQSACRPLGGSGILRSVVQATSFGAVSEYHLPSPLRWSNAMAAAPDGSVWFGEQSVPGVGHLYPNGTLVEYPWPSKPRTTCGYQTGIWGVALWNGMVWGTDFDGNAIVGVDPLTGSTKVLNVSGTAPFPYTLAVSPDGTLWFTSLSDRPVLGRVEKDMSVSVYGIALPKGYVPAQVQFANSTYAYFVAIDPAANSGGVFAFDSRNLSRTIGPVQVGPGFKLLSPNSISVSAGRVWVTQHYPAIVASYEISTDTWTSYPTSTMNYTSTTLPYFIQASGGMAWFNEHYGNRIGVIDVASGTLTEYSEANQPVANASDIQNDLTIALAGKGLWFTSTTGNYIGFVDALYRPPFVIAVEGSNTASIAAGSGKAFQLIVRGNWSSQLKVQVSDSEGVTAVPRLISVIPGEHMISQGKGQESLRVVISADGQLKPGRYTVGVTVTDGLVYQTAYVFLTIT